MDIIVKISKMALGENTILGTYLALALEEDTLGSTSEIRIYSKKITVTTVGEDRNLVKITGIVKIQEVESGLVEVH